MTIKRSCLWNTGVGFVICTSLLASGVLGEENPRGAVLEPLDVFELEFASDPQISPTGDRVVYVRNSMDVMTDRVKSSIWLVDSDGSNHRALITGGLRSLSPRWSPDGSRLLYLSDESGSLQIHVLWVDSGQTAKLTGVTEEPSGISWSPDGQWVAFSMLVPENLQPMVEAPPKPEGADWAPPARVIDRVLYRKDGKGYLKPGFHHLFVLPSEGGTPRQLTSRPFDHFGDFTWSADGHFLLASANRHDDPDFEPLNFEIYEISVPNGATRPLTDRDGPDTSPVVSTDGRHVAYVGFDDLRQGYQVRRLYVMNRDGTDSRELTGALDRSVQQPLWYSDGASISFLYSDKGNTRIGKAFLDGEIMTLARDVGGLSLGRPYASGSFSLARNGRFAYTRTRPDHPAEIAVGMTGSENNEITRLNQDLLGRKTLAEVEEIWWNSSFDGRKIHGWIVKPPHFEVDKKYPFILEIHGGPFENYGDRFAAEIQLFAAAGYVVLYANPRGSTSYGEEFGNLIHHNYPGNDYDDLMSGVDTVLKLGFVDPSNLFVTGGSGGGVLTSWIVGRTDRFAAAVVAKPVINWYSFALTSDIYTFFCRYWFPGFPWEHPEHYLKRSPLSLVGNVKTPTMLLTGEEDHRTPISESEQYYQALKLRKVDSVLVRIPGASHDISTRPSHLITKVMHILKWFEKYRTPPVEP